MKQGTIADEIQKLCCMHTWYPVLIKACLTVPSLLPSDFCGTRVLGTRGNNTFCDVVNLNGALEGPFQCMDKTVENATDLPRFLVKLEDELSSREAIIVVLRGGLLCVGCTKL